MVRWTVALVILEQLLKASGPIDVTLLGMVKGPVKPKQPAKAESSIEVTLLGIVSGPVKPVQTEKTEVLAFREALYFDYAPTKLKQKPVKYEVL